MNCQRWPLLTGTLLLGVLALGSCAKGAGDVPRAVSVSPPPASRSLPPAAPATMAAPRAPLLIVVVVDQLAAWVMAERLPSLSPDGAFARLRREGLFVRELRYEHATTSTAPG